MPKHPYYESAIHHFLLAARRVADLERVIRPDSYPIWQEFVNTLQFHELPPNAMEVAWKFSKRRGKHKISLTDISYYYRGDTLKARTDQQKEGMVFHGDSILQKNMDYYEQQIRIIAQKAHLPIHAEKRSAQAILKIADEEELSNEWARSIDPKTIDIFRTNTACTSPELRYIHKTLGDIKGKKILDVGCGLGEVSVFFATKGAKVTALDLSQPMLDVAQALAKLHKTKIQTIHASIEEISSLKKNSFDIVYVGNLFHHVDIPKALTAVTTVLKKDGILVCWEPMHYNPIINVYRKLATKVRSDDESPLTLKDIQIFSSYFHEISLRWYWLTTLSIFLIMAFIQRRDFNKVRYWKAVIAEEKFWRPLYLPLEKLDRFLLNLFPKLGLICWNVVIIGKNKR